jgi:hypothetical protein
MHATVQNILRSLENAPTPWLLAQVGAGEVLAAAMTALLGLLPKTCSSNL